MKLLMGHPKIRSSDQCFDIFGYCGNQKKAKMQKCKIHQNSINAFKTIYSFSNKYFPLSSFEKEKVNNIAQ